MENFDYGLLALCFKLKVHSSEFFNFYVKINFFFMISKKLTTVIRYFVELANHTVSNTNDL